MCACTCGAQLGAEEEDHCVVARDPVDTVEAALAPEHVHGQWSNCSVKGRRRIGEKMKRCQ